MADLQPMHFLESNMTQTELLARINTTFSQCFSLIKKKNEDYATPTNALKNFQGSTLIGVSINRAILVRLMDKITRIGNLLDLQASSVKNESLEDSIIDAINYLAILKAALNVEAAPKKLQ